MKEALSLYDCTVMHQRHFPVNYRFTYRVFSLFINIDKTNELRTSRFFSVDRWNLLSVRTKDHGSRTQQTWREWINNLLDQQELQSAKHNIYLLCFPRILGYGFNPLSLWYCFDAENQLTAVICEVSNTFGEHHHYLLHNNNEPIELPLRAEKKKIFHVSPFINMHQQYQFTIDQPDDLIRIVIQEYENQKRMLVATQHGKKHPATPINLLRFFMLVPLMTFKVMIMIHWHALKIWLRGGTFYKKPEPPLKNVS